MRGVIAGDGGERDREAARAALARAVASGALGAGYAVRREGDGFVLDAGRARGDGPDRGRIDVAGDGQVTWSVSLAGAERRRMLEAIALAAFVSVAGVFGWSLMFYVSLPTGGAVGLVWAVARILADRARVRRQIGALVASLPVLVDARGQ